MKKYFLAILLTVLTTFALNNKVHAASTYTFSVNQNTTVGQLICSNDSSDNIVACSDFNYIKVQSYIPNIGTVHFQARTEDNPTWVTFVSGSGFTTEIITDFNNVYKIRYATATNVPEIYSVTFTMSDEEFATCPDQLPPDRSAIMDDFHNVFLKVIVGVIPISAIIFIVWFMIDMLSSLIFGRGR